MLFLRIKPVFLLAFLFSLISGKVLSDGTFNLSVGQLPDFRGVYPGAFSEVQWYYVEGSELSDSLQITTEGPFKVSVFCLGNFDTSLSLEVVNGVLYRTLIFVRFFPEEVGNFQGTITHQSGNVGPLTISLSGEGLDDLIPPGYYSSANAGGSRLKTQLFNIINNHQTQTYGSLWGHFEQTDATFAGKVWDMYSDTPCYEPPYVFTFVEDQDTGSGGTSEGDVFNREHSMPRSWFGGQVDPMHTDLFHIFPADKLVNARRADYPYGEVLNPTWTSLNGSKLGQNSLSGYSGTAFEPIEQYKGDIARGFFYMATRYEDQVESWTFNPSGMVMLDNNSYPGFEPWVINMLMQWNENDPVSQKEILRNQAIFEIQGNRNPFIDHPEFVERIWGDTTVSVGNFIDKKLAVFPNPAAHWFSIVTPNDASLLEIYTLCGKKTHSMKALPGEMRMNTAGINPGIYLLLLHTQQGIFREKLIINKNH
jgi:endonuclease I